MFKASDLPIPIQPKKIKLITLNEEFLLKFGTLKLYGDFLCEWLYCRAMKIKNFSWRWGKFSIDVAVYNPDGNEAPILESWEFKMYLDLAYYRPEYDF